MIKKKSRLPKPRLSARKIAGATVAAVAIGASLFLTFGKNRPIAVPSYTAIRVFDGDTFETKEKQYIRLSAVDAPETGVCGSNEAKATLEKLVLNKPLYLKNLYHDSTRSMALVYTKDGLVNAAMLASGWAEMNDRENVDLPELGTATTEARKKQIGLFSNLCTQSANPNNPKCIIKANNTSQGKPTYHFPGCKSYTTTKVELHHGDRWFCTEKEATDARYTKADTCPPFGKN